MREVQRTGPWGFIGGLLAGMVLHFIGQSPLFVWAVAIVVAIAVGLAFELVPPLREFELRWPVRRVARRGTWQDTDAERISLYRLNQGLFLVHDATTPSRYPGQKADVVMRLAQHGEGPLTKGTVASVEYVLGKQFEDHARVRTNAKDDFALEESLYKPLLVLARVCFTDDTPELMLERYINFPGDGDAPPVPQGADRDPAS